MSSLNILGSTLILGITLGVLNKSMGNVREHNEKKEVKETKENGLGLFKRW